MHLFTTLLAAAYNAPSNIPKVNLTASSVSGIFSTVLAIVGALCVVFIIVGGINYVISEGDSGKVTKAKHTIIYAITGLIVSMFAFVIVRFVIGSV